MDSVPKTNVINLNSRPGLFNQDQRRRLEDSVKPHTDQPGTVVTLVESALCVFAVELARRLLVAAAKKLAQTFSGK